MDATEVWLWRQARRVLRARERIELQQDINAAMYPINWQPMRLHLGEEAYDPDSPEYVAYVSGIAGEHSTTTNE